MDKTDLYYQKLRTQRKIGESVSEWVLTVTALAFMSFLLIVGAGRGCMVSELQARGALEGAGYTEGKLLKKSTWLATFDGCSDVAAFTYSAKNPIGTPIVVVVCAGWPFKAATIRIPQ